MIVVKLILFVARTALTPNALPVQTLPFTIIIQTTVSVNVCKVNTYHLKIILNFVFPVPNNVQFANLIPFN